MGEAFGHFFWTGIVNLTISKLRRTTMKSAMKQVMIWTAKKRMKTTTRTLLAALLLATLAGILFSPRFESPVQAQAPSSKFKVSDDLQGIMARDPNVWVP